MFGTGKSAEQFYAKYKDEVEFKFCLDNNKEKQTKKFHGVNVYSPYNRDISKFKIVISSMYYFAIRKQLKEMGLKEFKNFIPDSMFKCREKELAVIHGNCHTDIIQRYLICNKNFSDKWALYQIPRIYEFKNLGLDSIDESILKNCNLFLYQNINEKYQKLSSNYLVNKINNECICLKLPNTYGHAEGFFPQIISNKFNVGYDKNENGMFPVGDRNIIQFVDKNYSIDMILYKLKNENIYSKDIVYENLNNQFSILENKEYDCDIKIMDYIRDTYRKKRLFYEPNHPTNFLLKETTRRILKCLNIYSKDFETLNLEIDLGTWQVPIYPCVSKHLGLEFEADTGRVPSDRFENRELSFDEYVRTYIKYCYGIE